MTSAAIRRRPRPAGPETTGAAAAGTLATTLALCALTLGTTVGFGRLFRGTTWLGPLLVSAVAAHAVAWWTRRADLGPGAAVAASALGVALVAVWVAIPSSTSYGIPWSDTVHMAAHVLGQARAAFAESVAPTKPTPGFLLITSAAVGTVAALADWAAFRVKVTLEACLPTFSMLIFISVLDPIHRHRGFYTLLFLLPLVAFVLLHLADARASGSAWFASRARGGSVALLEGGAAIGAGAVAVALLVGPLLPTAHQRGIIDTHHPNASGAGSNRAVISPLVNIQDGLVQQSAIEFFTVRSTAPEYWRLTALDRFDGAIWSANESYRSVHQKLPDVVASSAGADQVDEQFSIFSLSSVWMPAAYEAEQISGAHQVSFNPESGSLITGATSSDDQRYHVRSSVATSHLSPALLNQVTSTGGGDPKYLDLPSNLDLRIRQLAARITGSAPTPYQKAKALQDYFRSAPFVYDLNVPRGHDTAALVNFLLRTHRGFCEQFAGAYGVLARAAGLPTRVAVGFTPGELQADGLYHVKGLNYHAWPEVDLGPFGWVAFEPTPGRGVPGGEAYTSVPAAQAAPSSAGVSVTEPTPTTAPATAPSSSPTTQPRDVTLPTEPQHKHAATHVELTILLGVLLLVVLAILGAAVSAWLIRHRARLREQRAVTVQDQILLAWEDAVEILGLAGAARRPAETIAEYARRAPASAGLNSDGRAALRELAGAAMAAAYAPGDGWGGGAGEGPVGGGAAGGGAGSGAQAAARAVAAAVRQDASTTDRLLWDIDIRRLRRPVGTG